jgi:large repetitive protein
MKHILLFILLTLQVSAFAQITCSITPQDSTLCYNDSIAIQTTVTGSRPYLYKWLKNGIEVPFAEDSIFVIPKMHYSDTATYTCIVTNQIDTDTSNDAVLHVHPEIILDTLYRYNPLGCADECKGQFKALASGGMPPFDYNWGGGFSQDTIVFGLCPGEYTLTITDANGCRLDSNYLVDVLKSPKIEFTVTPPDTIYLTNPNIMVQFSDTALPYITNYEWDFGDSTTIPNVNPAYHTFTTNRVFLVRLYITDLNGCDTTITRNVTVRIADLKIANGFSPNGDEWNQTFMIEIKGNAEVDYRTAYLGTELWVYDRWGKRVYHQVNYKSGDWDGGNCPDGVYYYVLKCKGQFNDEDFRGSVTILGRSSTEQP